MVKPKKLLYEVVVVDDGSKDDTLSKAREYATRNDHVKIITYNKNRGKGHAVQAGFMQTTGDVVVFVDSDRDIDVSVISSYVAALKDGDIAIASKWHPDSSVEMPIFRKVMSHSFNVLVRLLVGIPFKDTQAGLKAMRREAFENIFPKLAVKRYAFDVELLAVAQFYGLKVVEMPTHLSIGSPFKFKEVLKMFMDVLGIAYRLRCIHWYQSSSNVRNSLQNFTSLVLRDY
jgi:dolichol-phosphate mannosyltransferase